MKKHIKAPKEPMLCCMVHPLVKCPYCKYPICADHWWEDSSVAFNLEMGEQGLYSCPRCLKYPKEWNFHWK